MIRIEFASALPKGLSEKRLQKALRLIAKHERQTKGFQVGVTFITPKRMRTLNRIYRGKDKETDVLSFSQDSSELSKQAREVEKVYLGDVVVCPVFAKKEADRRGIVFEEELIRLFIHGVLHLRGYEHDSEEEEFSMFEIQEKIVEATLS